jgi:DNA-binding CsgD family transcriptional regulator
LTAAIEGNGRVVVMGGEAGIGKTTLVRVLAGDALRRNVRVLQGNCYDVFSTPAFGPWLELFASPESDPSLPNLPEAFSGGATREVSDQAALFASVRDFFAELSRSSPVLLILEDLHWSDLESLDLLRDLSRRATRMRLLIVVTYRTDDLGRTSPFYHRLPALIRETACRRIELRRLDRDQLGALVDSSTGLSPPDRDRLIDYLARHSEGNPFFATELIRTLLDRGLLAQQGNTWELAALDRIALPPLLVQVIDARVSRLGNDIREWLATASVIGQDVPVRIWSAVACVGEDALHDAVDQAIEAHILEVNDRGTSVRFVHALTRSALYDSVLPLRRRAWHARVASTLMQSKRPDPDAVAHHLQMAGDPEAWRWLVKAAERARNAYAWATACERYRAAATQVLESDPEASIVAGKLLYRMAFLQRFSDPGGGAETVELARRLPGLVSDPIANAESLWAYGILLCYANRLREGIPQFFAALESVTGPALDARLPGYSSEHFIGGGVFSQDDSDLQTVPLVSPDERELSLADVLLAQRDLVYWLQVASGDLRSIREGELIQRSEAVAERGERTTNALIAPWISLGLGVGYAALGQPGPARTEFSAAKAGFRGIPHYGMESQVVMIESADVGATYGLGEPNYRRMLAAEGEAALRRAGGALRSGLSPRIAWLRCMVLDGRWTKAMDILATFPSPGNAFLWRDVRWAAATLARCQGDSQDAWSQIHEVFPNGPEMPPGEVIFQEGLELQRLAADLCLDAGDTERARRWLGAHDGWLEWSDTALGRAEGDLSWGRLCAAEARIEEAEARAFTALLQASDLDLPGVRLGAHRLLGELALGAGRIDAAIASLTAALDLAQACELPFERALTQISLATAHAAAGQRSEAAALLAEARSTLLALGAEPAMRRASDLAVRLELSLAGEEPDSGLTQREREVLRLLVAGRSNQAIADELFISWTTARTHVSNIFRKLGVSTRAEAVDAAHRRGIATT